MNWFGVYGLRQVLTDLEPNEAKVRHAGQCRRHPRRAELTAPADHGSTFQACSEAIGKGHAVNGSTGLPPIRTAKPLDSSRGTYF